MPTRYLILATVASALSALSAPEAQAAWGDFQLTLEGGVGRIAPSRSAARWGRDGAVSASLGLTDRLGLELVVDRKRFDSPHVPGSIDTYAAGIVYALDVTRVTPFVELAFARTTLHWGAPYGPERTWVPSAGAGFDIRLTPRLLLGAVVRYYALFDSALFDRPGYTTLQARLALRLPPWSTERTEP